MIDTHCHLTYDGLHERVDEVLAAAREAGVDRMVSVGTTPEDADRAIALAERYDNVYATVGVHPHYADRFDGKPSSLEAMWERARHPKVVAIGEMGLDWHYPDPPRKAQQFVFEWQLKTGKGVGKPMIIHNREATGDVLETLRLWGPPPEQIVFHCFTGSVEEVEAILAFGAYVGFTGIVTFKSAANVAAASDRVPLDRLLIETDSPYLTPEPHRKIRPNEPKYVAEVARYLAARRGMSVEAFTAAVDANAERFYRLAEVRRG